MVCCIGLWGLLAVNLFANGQALDPIRNRHIDERKPQARVINLPNYDQKKLHFGFFLALNYTGFVVKRSQTFTDSVQRLAQRPGRNYFNRIDPRPAPGFTTGFIVHYRLHDQFEARVLPTVSFYQRSLEYGYLPDSTDIQLAQSTYSFIELPLLIKYKSVRRRNTRMFMTAGIKPSFEVGPKKREIDAALLRPQNRDLAIEYGFGVDIYYPLFKFSPELRFSHGLVNMAVRDDNVYAQAIRRMTTHTVTLYFNFN